MNVVRTLCLLLVVSFASSAASRPNIVLIFADDLGWKGVGYQGATLAETPNIDRLAREGITFSEAYAAGANCAPSRACLLSGTYTPRHHVYAVGRMNNGPKELQRLLTPPNKSGLAVENVTLADALKAAGYVTGIFGKWHLGGPDGASPKQQGFDVVVDTYAGAELGGEVEKEGAERQPRGPALNPDPKGIYSLTKAAGAFMETNRNRPFFAYVAHHAIHSRLEARPDTMKDFEKKKAAFDALRSQRDTHGASERDESVSALYAASTFELDRGVGLLMAKLAELGLDNNTLVIFTSDNGGTQKAAEEPLRGNKGCYYEGGVREPFIAWWPGKIKPGSCGVPIINVDLYPTFLAVAGAKVPEGKVLDGENLLPLFLGGRKLSREAIFWHFPGYLQSPVTRGRDPVFRTRPVSVIRKGDWKLHLFHEEWQLGGAAAGLATNNAVELYNIKRDIGERQNLATKDSARRDRMVRDLLRWMKQVDAPMPTQPNPHYTGVQVSPTNQR